MGSLCTSPDPTIIQTPSTQTTTYPDWYQNAVQNLITGSAGIARAPYQAYTGPRQAPLSQDEQAAFQATRQGLGAFQPFMSQAQQNLLQASGTFPGADISSYMDPYRQGVIDIAKREALRGYDINRVRNVDPAAVRAGAFGGTRHGVLEAENWRNLQQRLDDIQMTGMSQAFTQAGQLYQADQARLLAAAQQAGTLGGLQQRYGLADAAALQAVGEAQRAFGQKGYDIAYQDFLEQRGWPQAQASWLSNIVRGVPISTTTTSLAGQALPQASPLSQIAGLGMTGLGLYGLLAAKGGPVKRRFADGGSIASRWEKMTLPELIMARQQAQVIGDREAFFTLQDEISKRQAAQITRVPESRGPATSLRDIVRSLPGPGYDWDVSRIGKIPVEQAAAGAAGEMEAMGGVPALRAPETVTAPRPVNPLDVRPASPAMTAPVLPVADRSYRERFPFPERDVTDYAAQFPETPRPEFPADFGKANPWQAVLMAGLGTLAAPPGISPLQAVGRGGLEGAREWTRQKEVARGEERERRAEERGFRQEDRQRRQDIINLQNAQRNYNLALRSAARGEATEDDKMNIERAKLDLETAKTKAWVNYYNRPTGEQMQLEALKTSRELAKSDDPEKRAYAEDLRSWALKGSLTAQAGIEVRKAALVQKFLDELNSDPQSMMLPFEEKMRKAQAAAAQALGMEKTETKTDPLGIR